MSWHIHRRMNHGISNAPNFAHSPQMLLTTATLAILATVLAATAAASGGDLAITGPQQPQVPENTATVASYTTNAPEKGTTVLNSQWIDIGGETSATYTPTAAGRYLRVTAIYDDGLDTGQHTHKEIPFSVANEPPTFSTPTDNARSIPENNQEATAVGPPFAATDPNGDLLTFSLSGTGTSAFTIDSTGQLRTGPGIRLDYETQSSYTLTVELSDLTDAAGSPDNLVDDTIEITVTVTDANDPGMVSFSNAYPINGVELTAALTDQDGTTSAEAWQWTRSPTPGGTFSIITGATQASYTPGSADVGQYLRATVTYTDDVKGLQGQTTNGTTANPVGEPISFSAGSYERYIFEQPLEGWTLLPEENTAPKNASGQVTLQLTGPGAGEVPDRAGNRPDQDQGQRDQSQPRKRRRNDPDAQGVRRIRRARR